MAIDDTPNGGIIDSVAAVDDTVAEADDSGEWADASSSGGVIAKESIECLADDLELALDRASELTIRLVFGEGALPAPVADTATRFENVK